MRAVHVTLRHLKPNSGDGLASSEETPFVVSTSGGASMKVSRKVKEGFEAGHAWIEVSTTSDAKPA